MSRSRIVPALTLTSALIASVFACGDDVTPPEDVPGDLALTLVSPNGPEGAVVLETTHDGIVGIESVSGHAYQGRSGGTSRIVVFLDDPGEIRFTLSVQDVNSQPVLEVVEVADPDNRLRANLAGYEVAIAQTGATLVVHR